MIELKNISKVYQMGDQTIKALDNVDLTIKDGEYIAIIGPSGSGKSTLMNVLGCLDNPSAGQYLLNGKDVSKLRDDQLADARNKNIGFVFQRFNLMSRMSAMRNVEMPARYGGLNMKQRQLHAKDALTAVGLADRVDHKPVELSGGQQQRVAIARALVNQPNILLADEPTGALDSKTGRDILDLFEKLHRERGITVIVVTHDPSVARRANRVVSIRDGRIESDLGNDHSAAPAPQVEEYAVALPMAARVAVPVAAAATIADNGLEATAIPGMNEGDVKPVDTGAPMSESGTVPARQSAGAIWKRGLIAVAIAAVVNVALGLLAGVLFPLAGRLPFYSPLVIAGLTALIGVIAVAVYALINRLSSKPARVFRVVSVSALLLSLVPGAILLSNPRLMFQFAGTSQRGQGQFASGQFNAQAETSQFNGGQANSGTAASGASNGQSNRTAQTRSGIPGAGPLGAAFSGNNPQRANGGIAASLPVIILMLMPVLSFFIIVPALTRKPRHAALQMNPSGLT